MAAMNHEPHVVSSEAITNVSGMSHHVVVVKSTTKGAIDKNLIVHLLALLVGL